MVFGEVYRLSFGIMGVAFLSIAVLPANRHLCNTRQVACRVSRIAWRVRGIFNGASSARRCPC